MYMTHISVNVWKNFCCKEKLNIAMLEAASNGIFQHYWTFPFNIRWYREGVRGEAAARDEADLEDVKFVYSICC